MTDGRKIMWLWVAILNFFLVFMGMMYLVQLRRGSLAPLLSVSRGTETPASPTQPARNASTPAVSAEVLAVPEEPQQAAEGQAKLPDGIKLITPVMGVKPEQLRDTFADARSEGRVHNAIDIMAPHNTQVLAAVEGEIVRLFTSDKGGLTLYQLSKDRKVVFYYAHLDHYADGVTIGRMARQGEVIAYVGDTGNAGAGNYHLHFAVWLTDDPQRYWNGVNLNPYGLLKASR